MALVVFLAFVLLIALLAVYIVIERNREKSRELGRRRFNARVKQIQQSFQSALTEYLETRIIRPKNMAPLNGICSHFFVVQSHSQENLAYLEYISDRVLQSFQRELTKADARHDMEGLDERVQTLAGALPSRGIEYNRFFYHDLLPDLLTQFSTPELSAAELEELAQEDTLYPANVSKVNQADPA
ncbi:MULTISPECIES: hypothetical protein [unclassified Pseudoalteromonas]|uniref:hypothetical protein n=1 Tax=unclassified Pseudoalteromonas TaxID=194690 RepID=UPI000CF7176A|nr:MULTISPECIES: hypothetical protein [unclassified Pseudoalteromonas]MBS3798575.1 hypothetical protein [Pseudoalteromonas sp. BDTF-M6]